jgi:SAM-dependent methyltransferase
MNKKWIKYLCDPTDKSLLIVDKVVVQKGNDIISGTLKSKSGNLYQIKDGVPILLNQNTQPTKTVDSFAYEWKNFDFDYGRRGWNEDIVKPILGDTKYFKNKTIIDCGAGSGRQSLWMAEAGAKFVFSVELSDSARSMVRKVTSKYKNRVFVIQADIAHLPIKKTAKIDVAYCINVIQHTKNPIKATGEISKLLDSKSEFVFNIYLRRGNLFLIDLVQGLKRMLDKFPKTLIRFAAFFFAIGYYPLKSKYQSFKELWLDIYDLLGTHYYQKFYTGKELQNILEYSGLRIKKRSKYALVLVKII